MNNATGQISVSILAIRTARQIKLLADVIVMVLGLLVLLTWFCMNMNAHLNNIRSSNTEMRSSHVAVSGYVSVADNAASKF